MQLWEPCDSVSCCTINLLVCRDVDGSVVVTTIGQDLQSDSCSNYSRFVDNGQSSSYEVTCEGACDWLLNMNEQYFGKEIFINQESKEALEELDKDYKLKLSLAYQDNVVKLLINSKVESDNLNVSIFTLEGKELKSLNAELKIGRNEFLLDYNEVSSGLYFISISLDGYLLKTEKIIKVK